MLWRVRGRRRECRPFTHFRVEHRVRVRGIPVSVFRSDQHLPVLRHQSRPDGGCTPEREATASLDSGKTIGGSLRREMCRTAVDGDRGQIDRLLSRGDRCEPGSRSLSSKLGTRPIIQRAVEEEFDACSSGRATSARRTSAEPPRRVLAHNVETAWARRADAYARRSSLAR